MITAEFEELIAELLRVRRDLVGLVRESSDALDQVHPSHHESAKNLLHYIALRSRDLRPLQMRLANVGLSSLGRAESHVLSPVDSVLTVLHRALGRTWPPTRRRPSTIDLDAGSDFSARIPRRCSGHIPPDRGVAIMVTMPERGGRRLHDRSSSGRARHGLHAHQLCAR